MLKIAVVGERETVIGFKALGLEVFPVSNDEEAHKVFKDLTKTDGGYAIIYLEEAFSEGLSHEINRFKDLPNPAIILIPGRDGSLGFGQNALKSAVERAVGSDII